MFWLEESKLQARRWFGFFSLKFGFLRRSRFTTRGFPSLYDEMKNSRSYLALLFFPLDRLPSHFSQLPPQAFAFVGFSFKTRYIWIGEFIYLRVYLSIAELEVRSTTLALACFRWNLDFHEEIILQCGAFQLRTTKRKTLFPFDSPFLPPIVYRLVLANFLFQPLLPLFLLFRRVAVSYLHWQIYLFIYLLHKEFKLQARCSGLASFCSNLDLRFTVCDFSTFCEETRNSLPLWLFFFSLDRLPSPFSKLSFFVFGFDTR